MNTPIRIDRDTEFALTPKVAFTVLSTMIAAALTGALWAWGIGRDVADVKATLRSMDTSLNHIADSRMSSREFRAWLLVFRASNPDLVVPDPVD